MSVKKFFVMLMGILVIFSGVFSFIRPISTYASTGYVIGFVILCEAVGNIIAWFETRKYEQVSGWYLASTIVSVIFGMLILCSPIMQLSIDIFIVYFISIWVIIMGVYGISAALKIKSFKDKLPEIFRNKRWVGVLITGILMVIFGVVCLFKPMVQATVLGIFISMFLIFAGINLVTIGTYVY